MVNKIVCLFVCFIIYAPNELQSQIVPTIKFGTIETSYTLERVFIKWTTEGDMGDYYFVIHRSLDGISYEQIGHFVFEKDTEESVKSYMFCDNNKIRYQPYWYKVECRSMDGWGFFSHPVYSGEEVPTSLVFPNPFHSSFTLTQYNGGTVAVIDRNGNIYKEFSSKNISMKCAPAGLYYLNTGRQVIRIVKY